MFSKFFIDRPVFAWVIALVIVLAGLLALRSLPLSQYPAVAPPAISFNITYPGASAFGKIEIEVPATVVYRRVDQIVLRSLPSVSTPLLTAACSPHPRHRGFRFETVP